MSIGHSPYCYHVVGVQVLLTVPVSTTTLLSGLYDIALLLKATFGAAARPNRIEDNTEMSEEKARSVGPGG